ncbi:D-2-hydroxyglutarate dehydrogenase YdiJ [Alcaligenes endophyticus]|uniref:FAD-binding oxidoreductase n=1 Tax=Alcaligenes endophyticus TaxID=1929088 RepID=A0ABT8ELZ0_9BURK|nr:FAD-binding and (Fe-S)-binding domain-containing protein [Alcaligenes endophyticus]MCX5591133.1 FAD-binding and (Fe-S)-binding domain-containing protein [Alcaligenes endophyticus]MDN4122289.1 FAD-binding oxidoreductase [Alcaligenes endophyticus]
MHIARLHSTTLPALTLEFLQELQETGFSGEISTDYATRNVLATDNSIYQRFPQAAVFPLHEKDVQVLTRVLSLNAYQGIVISARGGGTGTNGQSLTHGIVVDLSRHMNQILEINPTQAWVRVQAGVVKDQLNAALRPYGLFFAPELSTSNRATIGGMINTDASGQGSCTYGKTRDHVLELDTVLLGGQQIHSHAIDAQQLSHYCAQDDREGEVYRCAEHIITTQAELIAAKFPKLNRCLTGYDLAHLSTPEEHFNLNSVLCGSEGSLGIIVQAKLRVLPIPTYQTLINIRYASFMDALRDARALMAMKPLSIETVDSKVLLLAMQDMVWDSVAQYFPKDEQHDTLGINLIELSANTQTDLDEQVQRFLRHLQLDQSVVRLGHTLAQGREAVNRVYAMRKRAVGLLGNVQGEARPQPFVEDTAVPPENLPEFIAEFRALLDSYGLQYGMFGHVDAGVLHVRPLLDMKQAEQAALVRPISDQVAALTLRYGGLLWGEHGKGVRSEYAPTFFGELYPSLQQLKSAFDPHNQFNPGKIATPLGSKDQLLKLDEVPLRGEYDRQIPLPVWESYGAAMHCNGNGACYNYDPDDAMCPSWKASRDRVQSPKGRASLMREWLRLQHQAGIDIQAVSQHNPSWLTGLPTRIKNSKGARQGEPDFSHQVYQAMASCLACKSCAGQCPVKVNIPDLRARFLHLYHQRYLRPLRDYMVASVELSLPYLARVSGLYNRLLQTVWLQKQLSAKLGLVDSPLFSRFKLKDTLKRWHVLPASPAQLQKLSPEQCQRSVVLIPDPFTQHFETPLFAALIELCARLGYQVYIAPIKSNGKPLHVQGFLPAFERAARRTAQTLHDLARFNIPLVGLDPAMTLVYRQEYKQLPNLPSFPLVHLPQEWLASSLPSIESGSRQTYRLLAHCTEKTQVTTSSKQWQELFERRHLQLNIQATGCCGMSGTYGHEARNLESSKTIFNLSWAEPLSQPNSEQEMLATGYSCRSQVQRMTQQRLRHPIEILLANIRQQGSK